MATARNRDLDTITSALRTVADGARCNLASQQQAVVGRILHRWPDEPAAHAVAGASGGTVEPLVISEITALADGEVTLDVRRRTKQPDWTHNAEWSGSYPPTWSRTTASIATWTETGAVRRRRSVRGSSRRGLRRG